MAAPVRDQPVQPQADNPPAHVLRCRRLGDDRRLLRIERQGEPPGMELEAGAAVARSGAVDRVSDDRKPRRGAMDTRSWCVRPVTGISSSQAWAADRPSTRQWVSDGSPAGSAFIHHERGSSSGGRAAGRSGRPPPSDRPRPAPSRSCRPARSANSLFSRASAWAWRPSARQPEVSRSSRCAASGRRGRPKRRPSRWSVRVSPPFGPGWTGKPAGLSMTSTRASR